jgi:predicted dehydrogenase
MKVALIEVGHWHAGMHLRSLLIGGADIVGISDGQPGVAAAFAAQSGGKAFQNYREMLKTVQPEFVVALGRHVDMPAIANDLLQQGIPFAMEKPMATSADQLAPLVETARQRKAFVAVPFTNRYSPLWTHLEELEQAGRVGMRSHAHFRIVNGPPSRYKRDGVSWMLDPAISGGGCLRNLGIHAVDAFLNFAGHEEVEVLGAAVSHRVHRESIEEFVTAILGSPNGVIGTVEAGYSFASLTGGDFEWRVSAANCYLVERAGTLRVATLDDDQIQDLAVPRQGNRYDLFCADTMQRLRDGRPPIATIEDCYRAMRVIDEIYRKATVFPAES